MATRRERLQNFAKKDLANKIISDANKIIKSCDTDCMKQNNKQELKNRFLNAKKALNEAPYNLKSAKRNFYVYSYGQNRYNQIKEREIKKKIDELAKNLTVNHNEFMDMIDTSLKSYDDSVIYYNNMVDMYEKYNEYNEKALVGIDNKKNSYFLNARRVDYENEELDKIKIWYNISLIIYFLILATYIFSFIWFGLYNNKTNLTALILFCVFPFLIPFILYFLLQTTTTFSEDVKNLNVYFNGSKM